MNIQKMKDSRRSLMKQRLSILKKLKNLTTLILPQGLAVKRAAELIDSGKAMATLEKLIEVSQKAQAVA